MNSGAKKQIAENGGLAPGRPPGDGRVRAWVLVRARDADQAARALAPEFKLGGRQYVIVRADRVEWEVESLMREVNFIVPVDAASEDDLKVALGIISDKTADSAPVVARVLGHYPWPAHSAHTYVTQAEFNEDPDDAYRPPGRHGNSPGRNGWG